MKNILKNILYCFVQLIIAAARRLFGMEGVHVFLLFLPAEAMIRVLRRYGAKIGEGVDIRAPLIVHNADSGYGNLHLGDYCHVGKAVFFDLKERITAGDRVIFSMRTTFITHTHAGRSSVSKTFPPSTAPIEIASDAYIGTGATLLQGVTLGSGAVVGAGSLVRHSVPENTVVAGNPAREIRKIHD